MPFCHTLLKAPKPPPPGYPQEPRTLGEHIRKRRLDLGLTQQALARLLGVDEWTVINWEVRGRTPSLKVMPAVVRLLGGLPEADHGSLTLGQHLRRYRRSQGRSQKQLAARLEVDPSTVARWETGRRRPAGSLLMRVEALLGISLSRWSWRNEHGP